LFEPTDVELEQQAMGMTPAEHSRWLKDHEPLVYVECQMCDGHIFVVDDEYGIVWSHLEDTGCDDPTPKETA
jgi:hypothetical protein